MTTLKEAVAAIQSLRIKSHKKKSKRIADELLGKFRGVLPKGKSSTELIRELRDSLYGKIQ